MKIRIAISFLAIVFFVVLDQWTKLAVDRTMFLGQSIEIIPGLFNLTYVRNPGAAFGMGAGASDIWRLILLKIIPVIACVWLIALIWLEKHLILRLMSFTLILAGAIGNLIDRFRLDYVIDFLDFHWYGAHFPAFNVADSCISVGAGLLLLDFMIQFKNSRSEPGQKLKN